MIGLFLVVCAFLAAFSAATNANTCSYGTGYCSVWPNLVQQNGPSGVNGYYATAQLCANDCSANANYNYFNWVPGAGNCFCAGACDLTTTIANPNVQLWGVNGGCPGSHLCWTSQYCSNVVDQSGLYTSQSSCNNQCIVASKGYNFATFLPTYSKCQCNTNCPSLITTTVTTPPVTTWALNSQTCTVSGSLRQ